MKYSVSCSKSIVARISILSAACALLAMPEAKAEIDATVDGITYVNRRTDFILSIVDGTISIQNGGTLVANDTASFMSAQQIALTDSGTSLVYGDLRIQSSGDLSQPTGYWSGTVGSAISGVGTFKVQDGISVYLGGSNFGFSGKFDIGTGSTLIAFSAENLGTANVINNGTLTLNMLNNEVLGSSQIISGTGKIVKEGDGALSLTSDSSVFSGTISLTKGTLSLGTAFAQIGGSVQATGGTFAGVGTFGNAGSSHVFSNGAVLHPGLSGTPGTLHVNGNVTMSTGSALLVNIQSTTAYSMLAMSGGNFTFNGGELALMVDAGYAPQAGDRFDLVTGAGAISIASLKFNDSPIQANDQININGTNFTVLAEGSTLSLVAVPEPSTYGIFGGAGLLGAVVLLNRRTKRNKNSR